MTFGAETEDLRSEGNEEKMKTLQFSSLFFLVFFFCRYYVDEKKKHCLLVRKKG